MKKSEFEKDLEIDVDQLDIMAASQGELFFKWAEKATEAKAEVEQAKFRLEICISRISNDVRKNPKDYEVEKVTNDSVDVAVKSTEEYQEAYTEWLEAKKEADLISNAVSAMEQKKRMIESLITLHGQQYFAGPSVPRSLSDAWKEAKKDREKKVVEKTEMRRRMKRTKKDD